MLLGYDVVAELGCNWYPTILIYALYRKNLDISSELFFCPFAAMDREKIMSGSEMSNYASAPALSLSATLLPLLCFYVRGASHSAGHLAL
jgi:hypothetical protein